MLGKIEVRSDNDGFRGRRGKINGSGNRLATGRLSVWAHRARRAKSEQGERRGSDVTISFFYINVPSYGSTSARDPSDGCADSPLKPSRSDPFDFLSKEQTCAGRRTKKRKTGTGRQTRPHTCANTQKEKTRPLWPSFIRAADSFRFSVLFFSLLRHRLLFYVSRRAPPPDRYRLPARLKGRLFADLHGIIKFPRRYTRAGAYRLFILPPPIFFFSPLDPDGSRRTASPALFPRCRPTVPGTVRPLGTRPHGCRNPALVSAHVKPCPYSFSNEHLEHLRCLLGETHVPLIRLTSRLVTLSLPAVSFVV